MFYCARSLAHVPKTRIVSRVVVIMSRPKVGDLYQFDWQMYLVCTVALDQPCEGIEPLESSWCTDDPDRLTRFTQLHSHHWIRLGSLLLEVDASGDSNSQLHCVEGFSGWIEYRNSASRSSPDNANIPRSAADLMVRSLLRLGFDSSSSNTLLEYNAGLRINHIRVSLNKVTRSAVAGPLMTSNSVESFITVSGMETWYHIWCQQQLYTRGLWVHYVSPWDDGEQ